MESLEQEIKTTESDKYKHSLVLLKELDMLMQDSEESIRSKAAYGEQIRNSFEIVWDDLTDEEQEKWGKFSEDLYNEWEKE